MIAVVIGRPRGARRRRDHLGSRRCGEVREQVGRDLRARPRRPRRGLQAHRVHGLPHPSPRGDRPAARRQAHRPDRRERWSEGAQDANVARRRARWPPAGCRRPASPSCASPGRPAVRRRRRRRARDEDAKVCTARGRRRTASLRGHRATRAVARTQDAGPRGAVQVSARSASPGDGAAGRHGRYSRGGGRGRRCRRDLPEQRRRWADTSRTRPRPRRSHRVGGGSSTTTTTTTTTTTLADHAQARPRCRRSPSRCRRAATRLAFQATGGPCWVGIEHTHGRPVAVLPRR